MIKCVYSSPTDGVDDISFEVEICKIPRLALHGVRFKRHSGNIWEYKTICTSVLKTMEEINKVR